MAAARGTQRRASDYREQRSHIGCRLPFIVEGAEPGIRAAIYGPAGWLPLGLAVLMVLVTRLRQDVRTPPIEVVGSRMGIWLVMLPRDDEPTDNRPLH